MAGQSPDNGTMHDITTTIAIQSVPGLQGDYLSNGGGINSDATFMYGGDGCCMRVARRGRDAARCFDFASLRSAPIPETAQPASWVIQKFRIDNIAH